MSNPKIFPPSLVFRILPRPTDPAFSPACAETSPQRAAAATIVFRIFDMLAPASSLSPRDACSGPFIPGTSQRPAIIQRAFVEDNMVVRVSGDTIALSPQLI